jgi:hypothetical protein
MDSLEKRRDSWLTLVSRMVLGLMRRDNTLSEVMCPMMPLRDPKKKQEALREVANLNKEIADVCERMLPIECGDPPLGVLAVLDQNDIDAYTRSALALLVAARHDRDVAAQIQTVADVVTIAAGRKPVAAVELRRDFEFATGSLRPLVRIVRTSASLDEAKVALRETVLAEVLGREPDGEAVSMEIVYGTASVSKRFND